MLARAGMQMPGGLDEVAIDVEGRRRTYRLAPAPQARAPLLIALHGAGAEGIGMAALSGLAGRGPGAGIAVAFPDGWGRLWNDGRGSSRRARPDGIDDIAFLGALVERLAADGVADPAAVHLAGISNGAFLAEHIARHARMPLAGITLVAGAATADSRQASPRPARPTHVVMFEGTADPIVPYAGGPIGRLGRALERRPRRGRANPGRVRAVGAETVAADWVAANGISVAPVIDRMGGAGADLAVVRMAWMQPGRPQVVLYRIEGGGHTWPGGPQYLPPRLVGAAARGLDATGLILESVGRAGEGDGR